MKETILDVLLYLFEHYFYDDPDAVRDRDSLQNGLIQAGFSPTEVSKAFDWLDGLEQLRASTDSAPPMASPLRLSATPVEYRNAPPLLGEHTDQILKELGYEAAAIEKLRADRVV